MVEVLMISERTLNMIRIVKDKKGRYIFYDNKKKTGYIIPENRLTLFFLLSYRHIFLVVIAFFLYTLNTPYPLLVGFIVLFFGFAEFYYAKKLLGNVKKIENYHISVTNKFGTPSKNTVLLKVLLYLVLAALMVILGLDKYAQQPIQPLFFLGAAASAYFGFKSFQALR
jgi:hypothetical protein